MSYIIYYMCLNPLLTLKINGKVISLKELAKNKMHMYEKVFENCKSNEIVEIKCGKCKECRMQKLMEMKKRLTKEYEKNKNSFFLTLTYDEKHKKELNKRDMQLFFKRYRKTAKFKYFYVGELGETTKRPHYHAIIFGELPKDIEESKRPTKRNNKQYESKTLQKLWKNGMISISKMEKPLISYILKYMLKNEDSKEFICGWSTKPPIGIDTENIQKDILKPTRTKAEKNFYKNHYGELPKIESEEEEREIKINEIEKQTKLKYYNYIKQKRQI